MYSAVLGRACPLRGITAVRRLSLFKRACCKSLERVPFAFAAGKRHTTKEYTNFPAVWERPEPSRFSALTKFKAVNGVVPMTDTAEVSVLGGKEDHYGGFIIDPQTLPDSLDDFSTQLQTSLRVWRNMKKRAIWLKVPVEKARFVGVAVDEFGFGFHHAESEYLMLVKWLPKEGHNLPPNASHQVGIGAFVLNDKGEVLAVQERSGPLKGLGVWKLPTGLINAGEDIADGAEREVLEETGVKTKFSAIISIRQAHGFAFGKSDLFFLCALNPVPSHQDLTRQESEIEALQWMPWDDFVGQEFMQNRATFMKMLSKCKAFSEGKYKGMSGKRLADGFKRRSDFVMWGESEDEDYELVENQNDTQAGARL